MRACLYDRCGHVGDDVIERAASDVAGTFYEGPICGLHADQLRADPMLIVEDLESSAG